MRNVMVLAFALGILGALPAQDAKDCLKGFDPVLLTQGTEKAGLEELALVHDDFNYRFASAESRATFQSDPVRYEIQIGGGCARMGSLGGKGDPDRFIVHDGRIYVFASDQCRDAFLKAPDKYIPKPEVPPTTNEAGLARGKELFAKALAHHGGAQTWSAIKTFRFHRSWESKEGQQVWPRTETYTFKDRTHFRHDTAYGTTYLFGTVLAGDDAFSTSGPKASNMNSYARKDFEREAFRVLPYLLIVAQDEGTRLAALGRHKVEGQDVEQLAISTPEMTTTLGLDPETSRVRTATWTGRGPRNDFGTLTDVFEGYQDVNGLIIPASWKRHFNSAPGSTKAWEKMEINSEIDPSLFVRPKGP